MATENKPKPDSKKRKQFLPHNKPVKKKGSYPLHPGVQGFFITCDGGRERQASHEAINVIDSFYEELVYSKDSTSVKLNELPNKPLNKKINFVYSDDEEEDDDNCVEGKPEEKEKEDEKEDKVEKNSSEAHPANDAENDKPTDEKSDSPILEKTCHKSQTEESTNDVEVGAKDGEHRINEAEEPSAKKQCVELSVSKNVVHEKVEKKSIDRLIEEELKELGDKSKRRFVSLDSGCNGVVFVQMRKSENDPSPTEIVHHMMTSTASTKKHMSRFLLRVLPVEVSCYPSEEEISKAMGAIVEKHFPADTQNPQKFAVLYGARANTGIDKMKIINAVAKSIPLPHKVDLTNPGKSIIVEIVKTVCLIGVVEKYKELGKYNLRQLTLPK
ncbi:uncharacterized protein LOC126672001 [Mercurialis annua]|uniref:uncharacterized protein LOC126672001 n=1 Tax=Mercurialis annua TaxID=3986 RepID=UPI0021610B9D|nr:uncharacterized protein LOC126672001 [Mercurialis annua]